MLGVFGNPEQTGKPAGDDLREGKRTPLIIVGMALAAPADARFIRERLGDPRLDDDGVDRIRRILVTCGALDRHEDLIGERVLAASAAIDAAPLDETVRTELRTLADALTRRRA
ncbi:MAG: polyprenyl synthetase family protein [Actinomycetes bacterium]|nr:polyprenyl synthetase family protein [Actinomycetes bacterium]MDX5380892.1 polyprenyl synthetase family protein [Actinomycetes bacterium]MDX5399976.1 polyprenyl synthetase family protein [Actinomycetes bacterium]MDX5450643.1 polyprenyl synthetase family protein [Actinomycetes bacterium]